MASRKNLKKNVNYIMGELFMEGMITCVHLKKVGNEKTEEILTNILNVQDEFVSRISHTEPGNVKAFYKKFREDFDKSIDGIIESIEKL